MIRMAACAIKAFIEERQRLPQENPEENKFHSLFITPETQSKFISISQYRAFLLVPIEDLQRREGILSEIFFPSSSQRSIYLFCQFARQLSAGSRSVHATNKSQKRSVGSEALNLRPATKIINIWGGGEVLVTINACSLSNIQCAAPCCKCKCLWGKMQWAINE